MARFGGGGADILENKAFLYVCFIIATISLIFFANVGDGTATAVFLISGYLISLFTKKMAIVLLLALVISYTYKYGVSRMTNYTEGMSTNLGNIIDDIVNDTKLQGFLNENPSHKGDITTILTSLKQIIKSIQTIQNDTVYIGKLDLFIGQNYSYFKTKIDAFYASFATEISGIKHDNVSAFLIEILDRIGLPK